MVGCKVAVVEHGGFNHSKLVPSVGFQQVFRLNFIKHTDKIDVCPILLLDFVEQVNARIVGEKSIFAVVKLQVHGSSRKHKHDENDDRKGLFWTVNAPIGQHHERISHDFCTFS